MLEITWLTNKNRGGKRIGPSRGLANILENVKTSREMSSGETLSLDEIQHLRQLLTKLDSPAAATSNYVHFDIAFNPHLNS